MKHCLCLIFKYCIRLGPLEIKPETGIKVPPLSFAKCKSKVLRMKKKGWEANKNMKLTTVSQLGKGNRTLFSRQAYSLYMWDSLWKNLRRNHTLENSVKGKNKEEWHVLISFLSPICQGSFYGIKFLEFLSCIILSLGSHSGSYR